MDVKWPEPELDRSIAGWDPLDELSVFIGDWLVQNGQGHTNLEIEAKVGRIVEGTTKPFSRIELPVLSEVLVEMQAGWRFESTMTDAQHAKINALLNSAVEQSKGRIRYKRQKEVDLFYTDRSAGRGVKVRVTKDAETMKTTATIRKRRLADLNVFCPMHAFDYRISINVEEPLPEPPQGDEPDFSREKNRLHYTHQRICVDLTQVTASNDDRVTNELELEFRNAAELMEEAQASVHAAGRQEWTPYYDSVLIFLNNIRTLIRNAD